MRTRVKICGITRPEDAAAAARAGADAVGLVFHPASARNVTVEQAAAIVGALPPFVTVVGLFVNADPAEVSSIAGQVPLDLLQYHGDETPAVCEVPGLPYLKAIRMRRGLDLVAEVGKYASARGIVLDSYSEQEAGGTGQTFDWTLVPPGVDKPLILAGGLDPDNVLEAIARVRPWAVDVSSGVEARKGIKDADRINAFIKLVNGARSDG